MCCNIDRAAKACHTMGIEHKAEAVAIVVNLESLRTKNPG